MKNNFISKFIASNNYLLIALIIAPILIYFAFGATFYETYEENLRTGEFNLPKDKDESFYIYNGTPLMGDRLRGTVKPAGLENNITAKEQYIYQKTLIFSMIRSAAISFLIGGTISALTWGFMIDEGSIVHLIFSKKSRKRAFVELFSYPIYFFIFISITSSIAISSEVLNFYQGKSMIILFLFSVLLIGSTLLIGYIFSSILSILSKNTFLPMIGSLMVLGIIFVFPSKRELVIPFESVVRNIKFGHPITDTSKVGMFLMVLGIILLYIIFKRRSYY